jgi:hypothetical protein
MSTLKVGHFSHSRRFSYQIRSSISSLAESRVISTPTNFDRHWTANQTGGTCEGRVHGWPLLCDKLYHSMLKVELTLLIWLTLSFLGLMWIVKMKGYRYTKISTLSVLDALCQFLNVADKTLPFLSPSHSFLIS